MISSYTFLLKIPLHRTCIFLNYKIAWKSNKYFKVQEGIRSKRKVVNLFKIVVERWRGSPFFFFNIFFLYKFYWTFLNERTDVQSLKKTKNNLFLKLKKVSAPEPEEKLFLFCSIDLVVPAVQWEDERIVEMIQFSL